MNYLIRDFILLSCCVSLVFSGPIYKLDPTWPNDPTIFTNKIFSAAINSTNGHVFVGQRNTNRSFIYEFDSYGNYLGSVIEDREAIDLIHGMRMHPDIQIKEEMIWVTDVGNGTNGHTVKQFDVSGKMTRIFGTPGKAGTSLKPVQFGNVADVAFDSQSFMYVVDGDGGLNNRLMKIDISKEAPSVVWSVGQQGSKPGDLYIPHSVDVSPIDGLVWVADRMNNRLQVFHPDNGSVVSSCMMHGGEPYSVRFSADNSHIVVAQLQNNTISLISSQPPSGFTSTCKEIDSIRLATDISPHLVAVDRNSGAVYVAEIGAEACQKYTLVKDTKERILK